MIGFLHFVLFLASIVVEILNVSKNEIDGTTFPELFESTVLRTLDFSFNDLNETFNVSSLLGLINIQNLHLAGCSILSDLPDNMSLLQSLVILDFESNLLYGTIPSTLGEMKTLESILLGFNELTGTIPSELGALENLKILDLQSNMLTGTVPEEIKSMTDLSFNYSGNSISDENEV